MLVLEGTSLNEIFILSCAFLSFNGEVKIEKNNHHRNCKTYGFVKEYSSKGIKWKIGRAGNEMGNY